MYTTVDSWFNNLVEDLATHFGISVVGTVWNKKAGQPPEFVNTKKVFSSVFGYPKNKSSFSYVTKNNNKNVAHFSTFNP